MTGRDRLRPRGEDQRDRSRTTPTVVDADEAPVGRLPEAIEELGASLLPVALSKDGRERLDTEDREITVTMDQILTLDEDRVKLRSTIGELADKLDVDRR